MTKQNSQKIVFEIYFYLFCKDTGAPAAVGISANREEEPK